MIKLVSSHRKLYLTVLPALLLLSSCGLFSRSKPYIPPRNKTDSVVFKCDRYINKGMALPVDVIYVTGDDNLKQVTAIGPDAWFDSKEREDWAFKQTLMLKGGDEIILDLSKPPETRFIVIFASFYQVKDQKVQQVIFTPDAGKQEVIWVGAQALYH
jgi:hypothetical protein